MTNSTVSEGLKTKHYIQRSKKLRYFLALIVISVIIMLIWTITYILKITTYPNAKNSSRHKNYGFTRIYHVKGARNVQSGINLGVNLKDLNEGDWGLVLEEYDFDVIRDVGFYHIRVPVQFLPHLIKSGDTYQLDQNLLTRLDWVIENILERDMIAILDFHYLIPENTYSFDSKQESIQNEQKFLAVWKILAGRYKDYPSELYFELANEPHKPIMPDTWNTYIQKALDQIRSSGGNNATRMVIIGTNVLIGNVIRTWDNVNGIYQLKLPSVEDDPNIMVTFHYYDPVPFTYQGETYNDDLERYSENWLDNMWDNTDRQKACIRKDFDIISQWAQENKRDIILGEFGVTIHADIESQVNWTRLIREEAESRGMIWIFWQLFYDDGNGDTLGGLYNRSIGYWREEILHALLPEDEQIENNAVKDGTSDEWNEERVQKVRNLIATLQDPEWKIRKSAAIALRTTETEAELAVPALIDALKDEEWQVRKPATLALAAIGPVSHPAIPALIEALKDEEWQVRKSAAQALPAIGPASQSAIPALIEALKDEEWQVRKIVVLALSCIAPDDPNVLTALQKSLNDPEDQVRHVASTFLRSLNDKRE
jgi:endoglucanase